MFTCFKIIFSDKFDLFWTSTLFFHKFTPTFLQVRPFYKHNHSTAASIILFFIVLLCLPLQWWSLKALTITMLNVLFHCNARLD